jgi:Mg-chelatase subunit ChlD
MLAGLCRATAVCLAFAAASAAARAETNVLFIVDASGSMKKAVDGEPRMTAAKRVLAEALAAMPADARLGMLVYGHRKAKDCKDIELVAPIGAEDASILADRVQELTPKGETPIAAALQAAAKSFAVLKGQQNTIVLVTDGIEECQGDPCAAARAIREAGLDLKVDIVGFTLKQEQKKLIECVATETGGTYYDAKNAAALSAALTAVSQAVAAPAAPPQPAPPPDDNLLLQANGGTLLAAPSADWLKLNDGQEERVATYTGEGIWSFKDGKPATFDSFEVLIDGTNQYNLKEFELFAGDEGPTGSFRSIGRFQTQNLRLIQSPYQKFTFAPTTARYFKAALLTDHGGGYISTNEFRLHGKLDEVAAASAAPAAPTGIDLLAQANGGTLVAAPNQEWLQLNDGKEQRVAVYAGEGVWAFKDGKPATFDAFEVLIDQANQYNLKEFELFVGDEGPTGAFRSVGKFSALNIRMVQSPYQRFSFAPATGRYLKVALLTDQGGGYISTNEFRLWGTLDEAAAAAPAAAAPTGSNILAAAGGGTLVAAPNQEWSSLTDGKEDRVATYAGEGVWSFKDRKPATFEAFEVLIDQTNQYNLKEFELFAGDEGPDGAFRSIGRFATQNIKMVQSPYQRFSFAPTTARFLKVAMLSDHGGGYISTTEFRLFGAVDEAAAPMPAPAAAAGTDLIARANGGNLLGAPNDEWAKLNDGAPDRVAVYAGEGIWAFPGEKAATIDRFEVLIPQASQYNLKEFELFVSEESPAGPFRSIGKFATRNYKQFPDGFQAFTFAPAKARYLKAALLTDHGGDYIAAHEFRLFGQLEP